MDWRLFAFSLINFLIGFLSSYCNIHIALMLIFSVVSSYLNHGLSIFILHKVSINGLAGCSNSYFCDDGPDVAAGQVTATDQIR